MKPYPYNACIVIVAAFCLSLPSHATEGRSSWDRTDEGTTGYGSARGRGSSGTGAIADYQRHGPFRTWSK